MTLALGEDRLRRVGLPAWQALVVHDLKNALGVLEARLGAMVHAPSPAAAEQAHRQCGDLRRRLVGLLLVQRDEAEHGLPAWLTDESPIELLSDLADAPPWAREDLKLECTPDPSAPACWTFDRPLVRMALDAALHNAGRHARHRVVIRVRSDQGGLLFEVLDDGPGPAPSAASTRGTGLGTALCDAVARAHRVNGRIGSIGLDASGLTVGRTPPDGVDGFAMPPPQPRRGARFSLWLP